MIEFDAKKETESIIQFIRDYYKKHDLNRAIIGISGGKDSGVVAGLFTEALGKENVIGVTMPCHTIKEAKVDAKLVSDYYGFKLVNFDIGGVFDAFKGELTNLGDFTEEETKNSDINLKPRLRMATLYYLAALYSAVDKKKYLVAGTSNKGELYVGYFTKGGDSVHDISVLADFFVDEVIKIGEYIKVPEKVLYKTPNDDLSNITDEDKLGFTYDDVKKYCDDENSIDKITAAKIKRMHEANLHKFNIPTYRRENA